MKQECLPKMGGGYSTSEVNTGLKWIDGKDIYQKTVNFQAAGTGWEFNSLSILASSVDKIWIHEFYAMGVDEYAGICSFINEESTLSLQIRDGYWHTRIYKIPGDTYITVRYTKASA